MRKKADEINCLLHVMPSKLFSRNLQTSTHNHHLETNKLQDWKMHQKHNKYTQTTAIYCRCKGTQRTRLASSDANPILYLLSMQSFPRTEKTEKNLFYLLVIANEPVGGTGVSKKRRRRKSERCRRGTDSSPFENSPE